MHRSIARRTAAQERMSALACFIHGNTDVAVVVALLTQGWNAAVMNGRFRTYYRSGYLLLL
jgi:hypothetical protein